MWEVVPCKVFFSVGSGTVSLRSAVGLPHGYRLACCLNLKTAKVSAPLVSTTVAIAKEE